MIYREIGTTGLKASVIGLGAEHLENQPYETVEAVVGAALDRGVNIMDILMVGLQIRQDIPRALKGRRKDMLLQGHIGHVRQSDGQSLRTRDVALCRESFEELMKLYGTDYIDIGMMFYVETDEDFEQAVNSDYYTYVQKLKRDGVIRAIGASVHNPKTGLRLVESGAVDMLMFSMNPVYDMLPGDFPIDDVFNDRLKPEYFQGIDPMRARLYEVCQQRGVGITVMKALSGGWLLSGNSPWGEPLTVSQCIHYALTRPAVASVLVGCKTADQVLQACEYLTQSDEQKDFSVISRSFREGLKGRCVYCNHCLPCPSGIDIAALTRQLDIARLDESEVPATVRQHYGALAHKAGDCVECGSCEGLCPFNVKVIENMRQAVRIFGD